jgi:hypothetical protein
MHFPPRFVLRHTPIKLGPLLVVEQFPDIGFDGSHERLEFRFHLIMQGLESAVIIKDDLAQASVLFIR